MTLWEISEQSVPYFHLTNAQVAKKVRNGTKLPKPSQMELSDEFHELLQSCWEDYQTRPSFEAIATGMKEWVRD